MPRRRVPVVEELDDRDFPACWFPTARRPDDTEYRPVPGWPRHRVGLDHSVWVALVRDRVPYGWAAGPEGTLVSVPREQEGLALIAAMRDGGATYAAIAGELDRRGYPTKGGRGGWRGCTVRGIWHGSADGSPRWHRVRPVVRGDIAPSVVLHHGGLRHLRSVELLFMAAWRPTELTAWRLWKAGPRDTPPPWVAAPIASGSARPYVAPAPLPLDRVGRVEDEATAAEGLPDDIDDEGYARGSRHGCARLTEEKVLEARRLKSEGWSYPELVRRFGVGKVTLFYAISGRTWSHVPMG